MKESFNPNTPRENYVTKEEKVKETSNQIDEDKTSGELEEDRKIASAELQEEYNSAEEEAHEDNEKLGAADVEDVVKTRQDESIENSLESLTIGPILIVYRDNDLFEEYIPEIKKHFELLNGEVEVMSFPKGTEKAVIEKWYEENSGLLNGKVLLTDSTCFLFLSKYSDEAKTVNILKEDKSGDLDKILASASFDTLRDELGKNREDSFSSSSEGADIHSFEGYDKVLPEVFKIAFEDEKNLPEKIVIIQQNISDHMPSSENFDSRSAEGQKNIADKFVGYIEEAGFPSDKIEVLEDLPGSLEGIDERGNWVLIDGHNRKSNFLNEAMVLGTSFRSLFLNLSREGLLKFSKEAMKENLSSALNFSFKKDLTLDDVRTYLDKHYSGLKISCKDYGYNTTGILDDQVTNSEEANKIVKYLFDLISNDQEYPFALVDALTDSKISNNVAGEIVRKVIDKEGLDKVIKYSSADLIRKLSPDMFEDLIGKEFKSSNRKFFRIDKVNDELQLINLDK